MLKYTSTAVALTLGLVTVLGAESGVARAGERGEHRSGAASKHGVKDGAGGKHDTHAAAASKHGAKDGAGGKHDTHAGADNKNGVKDGAGGKHETHAAADSKNGSKDGAGGKHDTHSGGVSKHGGHLGKSDQDKSRKDDELGGKPSRPSSLAGAYTGAAADSIAGQRLTDAHSVAVLLNSITVGVAPSQITSSGTHSLPLPRKLLPDGGSDGASAETSLEGTPGPPDEVVSSCRAAIEVAAAPFGMLSVRATGAGSLRRHLGHGEISAPLEVRIEYATKVGVEIKQARIKCHLNTSSTVIGLT